MRLRKTELNNRAYLSKTLPKSLQVNHRITMVELSGFEPLTLCLQSRCSTN